MLVLCLSFFVSVCLWVCVLAVGPLLEHARARLLGYPALARLPWGVNAIGGWGPAFARALCSHKLLGDPGGWVSPALTPLGPPGKSCERHRDTFGGMSGGHLEKCLGGPRVHPWDLLGLLWRVPSQSSRTRAACLCCVFLSACLSGAGCMWGGAWCPVRVPTQS